MGEMVEGVWRVGYISGLISYPSSVSFFLTFVDRECVRRNRRKKSWDTMGFQSTTKSLLLQTRKLIELCLQIC